MYRVLKFLVFTFFTLVLFGADKTLTWDHSPDYGVKEFKGYKLYQITGTNKATVISITTNNIVLITSLPPENYKFYVTAFDTNNVESDPSNTLLLTILKVPTNFRAEK